MQGARIPGQGGRVPRICQFYGIVIAMFYNDHQPAHFHATYGEHRALVDIENAEIIAGSLPPRASRMVSEWARMRRAELRSNWNLARRHRPIVKIEPLE